MQESLEGWRERQALERSTMEEKTCSRTYKNGWDNGEEDPLNSGSPQIQPLCSEMCSSGTTAPRSGTTAKSGSFTEAYWVPQRYSTVVPPERYYRLQQVVLPLIVNRQQRNQRVVRAAPERKYRIERYYRWQLAVLPRIAQRAYRRLNQAEVARYQPAEVPPKRYYRQEQAVLPLKPEGQQKTQASSGTSRGTNQRKYRLSGTTVGTSGTTAW